jgi:hypothetical protein
MTDTELLGRVEFLHNELERIRSELKESTAELWTRGIVPPQMATRQSRRPSGQAAHQRII